MAGRSRTVGDCGRAAEPDPVAGRGPGTVPDARGAAGLGGAGRGGAGRGPGTTPDAAGLTEGIRGLGASDVWGRGTPGPGILS
ncbi:hypothetical protein KNE206_45970 [Kitasatospora sp. NE20-6]